ncbi:MAG: dihydrodipicolinate synthase family protein [Verrucomicrobiaceae bacterium]|nr:dihydrodipicolinate synthase family protein [Verrucomicrobiaceae bacterium]
MLPVFQTPFHEDETIDLATLEHEIAWLFQQGSDGIVMAMVSETLRLSTEERKEVATFICRLAQGRGTSVISVGAESGAVTEQLARHAESVGATAVMAIPPIAVALDEDELLGYYRRLLRSISIPVVVQDASSYVGRPMSIAMQARLLDEFGADRCLYKPEAPPLVERLAELRAATRNQAVVYEGSGGVALADSFQHGIAGTMPGADLIRALVPLWRALQAGRTADARRIHEPLAALIGIQTKLDAYLAVEKHLLVKQGVFKNKIVRGPVGWHMTPEVERQVDELFEQLMAAAA